MDKLDVRIFREFAQDREAIPLQSDIRKSLRAVAKNLGVDEVTVRNRVRKLQEAGFLKGWRVFPNPNLLHCRVAHCRCTVQPPSFKDDAIRKIKLIPGVLAIVNYFGDSIRVTLYFEDEQSFRKLRELITRICNSQDLVHVEAYYPPCSITLSHRDWEIVRSIQDDPRKSYDAISNATGISNKAVMRRLNKMVQGKALFITVSIDPRRLSGAMLGHLLVSYENLHYGKEVYQKVVSHLEECLLFTAKGNMEHSVFLVLLTNISEVRELLNWLKQQTGVRMAHLDIVEEYIEQYEVLGHQLEKQIA